MLTFVIISAFILAALGFGAIALPFLIVGAVIWLVMLPIRFIFGFLIGGFFRVIFGVLGGLFGLLLAPLLVILLVVGLVVAFVGAVISLLTPLIPVVLLLLLGWGIYRASHPQSQSPAPF